MALESAMYKKVRDFVVRRWQGNESLTGYDAGQEVEAATGRGMLFREEIRRPDIYSIISVGGFELPLLGEGKRSLAGHEGMQALAQAMAYRELGMACFLFFPAAEFLRSNEAARVIRQVCRQTQIGLLSVPEGEAPIEELEGVLGSSPAEVAARWDRTLGVIKGIRSSELDHVYPSSLRDFIDRLPARRAITRDELWERFDAAWDNFATVLTQAPYDPMARKKVAREGRGAAALYYRRFFNAALTLGLIEPVGERLRLTPWGSHVKSDIEPHERFSPRPSPNVRRLMGQAFLRKFASGLMGWLDVFRDIGRPVSPYCFCLSSSCGYKDFYANRWFKDRAVDGDLDFDNPRCPDCSTKRVELNAWGRHAHSSGSWGTMIQYSTAKFARSVGVLSARRPKDWLELFPKLPTARPSGEKNDWLFYWRGPLLDARVKERDEPSKEMA